MALADGKVIVALEVNSIPPRIGSNGLFIHPNRRFLLNLGWLQCRIIRWRGFTHHISSARWSAAATAASGVNFAWVRRRFLYCGSYRTMQNQRGHTKVCICSSYEVEESQLVSMRKSPTAEGHVRSTCKQLVGFLCFGIINWCYPFVLVNVNISSI